MSLSKVELTAIAVYRVLSSHPEGIPSAQLDEEIVRENAGASVMYRAEAVKLLRDGQVPVYAHKAGRNSTWVLRPSHDDEELSIWHRRVMRDAYSQALSMFRAVSTLPGVQSGPVLAHLQGFLWTTAAYIFPDPRSQVTSDLAEIPLSQEVQAEIARAGGR